MVYILCMHMLENLLNLTLRGKAFCAFMHTYRSTLLQLVVGFVAMEEL